MKREEWFYPQVRARQGMYTKTIMSTIPGTYLLEATIDFMDTPIGLLYHKWSGNQAIEILQSYVHHQFRRLGVRTWMHEQLCATYPSCRKIVTFGTTKDSKPWIRKMGFKKDEFGDYVLLIAKKKKGE